VGTGKYPNTSYCLLTDPYRSAWLVSLASNFNGEHDKTSFIGFDIQDAHFPAAENLPPNLKLGILDAFSKELPEEHAEQYDVVHIRAFSSVVKDDNPGPLISNAYKMLKPGGYLQWDELDGGSFKAVPPGCDAEMSSVSTTATQEMIDTSKQSQKAMNLKYSWVGKLDELLKQHGFDSVEYERMEIKKELRSVMTVSLLLIHAHIARMAVRDGKMIGTNKIWDEVWANTGGEIGQGVSITMDPIVVVGRKPFP
jgi:hypothetical protein